ncbi:MAG: rubredoxin-like domain-containing protein, partial [Promethearchaeota archaeon]
ENEFYKLLKKLNKDENIENLITEFRSSTSYGNTKNNLEASIKEVDEIWQDIYPNFAESAKSEGYIEIANIFKDFTQVERNLSQRFKMFLNLINDPSFIEKNIITFWKCLACGYEVAMEDLSNDFMCPACSHNKTYFQKRNLNIFLEEKSKTHEYSSGWKCMECGYEVALDELPDNWKCSSCGRSKAYFKRITLKPKSYRIESVPREKAIWTCLECGHQEEIELPTGWKCSKCGFPGE